MARYKHSDIEEGQGLFLSINLKSQLLPGTFEFMLNDLIGKEIDISKFDEYYKNDETGAPANPPAALIKLIIYGYRKGMHSSRKLEALARENIVAKALTGDLEPHFTAIADFISRDEERINDAFAKVLAYCAELELIGGKDYAIDGVRLPSNASQALRGTEEELKEKLEGYRRMAEKHTAKHRRRDERGESDEEEQARYEKRQKKLNQRIDAISGFLEEMERKEGQRGQEIKSNVTDNDSALIQDATGGYLQGYIGIAAVDKRSQIIVHAEAVGSANECEHLPQVLDGALAGVKAAGVKAPEGKAPSFTMDANYYSEENLRACEERGVEAIIPDSQHNRQRGADGERRYEARDFTYHKEKDYYECPNKKELKYKSQTVLGKTEGKRYQASVKDCRPCPLSSRCIRSSKEPGKWDRGRQLYISKSNEPGSLCEGMRKKMDTQEYQDRYAYRVQIVEPVFANIKYCKGLDRFTLRGESKVNGQWRLYCIVHNLGKCLDRYNIKREGKGKAAA